jgi:transposase
MRGTALVNAATLIGELGDLSRFANPRQLMAYLGLVPSSAACRQQRADWRGRMTAFEGGAGEPSDTLLPGKAGDAAAVRRTLASTICRDRWSDAGR